MDRDSPRKISISKMKISPAPRGPPNSTGAHLRRSRRREKNVFWFIIYSKICNSENYFFTSPETRSFFKSAAAVATSFSGLPSCGFSASTTSGGGFVESTTSTFLPDEILFREENRDGVALGDFSLICSEWGCASRHFEA